MNNAKAETPVLWPPISCEELTHWKRLWCWEGLGAGGEGDDRGWDGWMASPTRWTWVWVNSGRWGWTGRPGVLRFMGSQRVGHDWATELNWHQWHKPVPTFSLQITQPWQFAVSPDCSLHVTWMAFGRLFTEYPFLTEVSSVFMYLHHHVQCPGGNRSVHGVPRTHSFPPHVHIQRVPWCSHLGNMSQRRSPLGFWWPKAVRTKCHSHLIPSVLAQVKPISRGQRAKFVARPGADIPFCRVYLSNKPSPWGKWWLQLDPHPHNRNRGSIDFFCPCPELSQAHHRQEEVSRWEGLSEGSGAGVGSSGKLCHQLSSMSGWAQTPVRPPLGPGFSSVKWQGMTQWSPWSGQAVKTVFLFPMFNIWWYLFTPGCEWHCCSIWRNISGVSLNVFYFPVLTVPPLTWKYFFRQTEVIRNNDD